MPTDGCGMAFTLIRRQVFEAMLHPAGPEWTNWFEMPKRTLEDSFFCDRAIGLGFRCTVDISVQVGTWVHLDGGGVTNCTRGCNASAKHNA